MFRAVSMPPHKTASGTTCSGPSTAALFRQSERLRERRDDTDIQRDEAEEEPKLKQCRTQLQQLALSDATNRVRQHPMPLWRIGEEAQQLFNKLSSGNDILTGTTLARIAAELDWPNQPSPLFLSLLFAVYSNTVPGERCCVTLRRDSWTYAFQALGATTMRLAAERMWGLLQADYRSPRHATLFAAFHRFVFVFLLLHHDALLQSRLESRPFNIDVKTDSIERYAVDEMRPPLPPFRRSISISAARLGIISVLGQLSPYAMSFCAFLHTTQQQCLNLDQWLNFGTFSRKIRPSQLRRHSDTDCWPTLIDDYVEWLRTTQVCWFPARGDGGWSGTSVLADDEQQLQRPQPLPPD